MSDADERSADPNEAVRSNPYTTVETLIVDAAKSGRQLALIQGAIWPAVGSVIELIAPNRDAKVVGVRLGLAPDGSAAIVVEVEDPGGES